MAPKVAPRGSSRSLRGPPKSPRRPQEGPTRAPRDPPYRHTKGPTQRTPTWPHCGLKMPRQGSWSVTACCYLSLIHISEPTRPEPI
eukprot:4223733-Pyramimonas_sp.AAC.1